MVSEKNPSITYLFLPIKENILWFSSYLQTVQLNCCLSTFQKLWRQCSHLVQWFWDATKSMIQYLLKNSHFYKFIYEKIRLDKKIHNTSCSFSERLIYVTIQPKNGTVIVQKLFLLLFLFTLLWRCLFLVKWSSEFWKDNL